MPRAKTAIAARLLAALFLLAALGGCASYAPAPLDQWPDRERLHRETQGQVTVSASILSDAEAQALYGVDLSDVGLQAVWLRIENASPHSYWLLVSALDANYFAPDEAAILFHWRLSRENEQRATARFRELAIPLKTPSGSVSEGFVLAPRHEGGRYLPVLLMGNNEVLSYGFAVALPDGEFDFEALDVAAIYRDETLPEHDLDTLRQQLLALPCCTYDKAGEREGDPLNVVLVGDSAAVLSALTRGGWSSTHRIDSDTVRRMLGAAISGSAYPVAPISPLYLFGRQQDLAMQRARSNILQRNHIRLWLAPFRFEGKPVWVGQVSRDIGIKATWLSPTLTTHVIDPNVDEAREHLLQSLLVSGAVRRFAFVGGAAAASAEAPRSNLTDDPFFSDGLRLVAEVSARDTIPPQDVKFVEWRTSADPNRSAVDTAAP
ncbi:hypothetical protein E4634_00275 [Mangrovimicrobium sediminis]|uniref:LssY-like C-terminal domain-containing protein n=1 Tax=Mangrovimicrobium sediminis TaxID=2562682 RepID=A0A4Z0M958_9GAMM|nr:LssY C-terminal domain-containing protein [Haliea sp. SAOS-164]TGD76024.1 hypothetical protein E4634_00275 [Haliea sp. SAOS-164]